MIGALKLGRRWAGDGLKQPLYFGKPICALKFEEDDWEWACCFWW